ncbi:MAG: hypothetical protein ACPGJS_00810 [Flammeovirgaceae bacterium]
MRTCISFIIAYLWAAVPIYSQITTTKVAPEKIKKDYEIIVYDSTTNFVGSNVLSLIGQQLYLPSRKSYRHKYGYKGFFIEYDTPELLTRSEDIVYKCCDSHNSKYSELNNRYFEVLSVHDHPYKSSSDTYTKKFFLALRESQTNDILYYEYDSRMKSSFPFIIVGYFEKEKKESIGQEYIITGKNWRETVFKEKNPMYDIITGEEVVLEKGSIWKVIDLTVEEKHFTLSYIIQNERGNKLTLDLKSIDSPRRFVYLKETVQDIIKNNPEYWQNILDGKVVIGMTKRMVKLAWGKPKRINKASYGDQWVYDNQYLYFKGDILKSFN